MDSPASNDDARDARDRKALGALTPAFVHRAAGARAFSLALACNLRYLHPPQRYRGAIVATLTDGATPEGPREQARHETNVALHLEGAHGLAAGIVAGGCSRCSQVFGPCAHVTVVAMDLAESHALRSAVIAGTDTTAAAARACAARLAHEAERLFEGTLATWLSPPVQQVAVDIAISPFSDPEATRGTAYGVRSNVVYAPPLTVQARVSGERKLLTAREITADLTFSSRDRRVLEHTRDRGAGRKATYASGVEASLTIEAARTHGRVFAQGYKSRLDFRAALARPLIVLGDPAGAAAPAGSEVATPVDAVDALVAVWTTDDGARFSFADSFYFPGPFPYVWASSGAIYPVASDVDPDFARKLALRPEVLVPAGRLKDAGARVLREARGRGVAMPAHEAFGLPPIETPRVALRLAGEPLDVTGDLVALYPARADREAREVVLLGPGRLSVRTAADRAAPGAVEDGRDHETEERARRRVEQAGLVPAERDEDDADGAEAGGRIAAHGEGAVAFWHAGLTALRDARDPEIDVQLSERLARVRVGEPLRGHVHVALEGDWLAARLEFASGELNVEIDAVRTALQRKQRWVALSDGTLARISASIEALADEAGDVMKGAAEARLPAHQLGRLDRWIEENDGRVDAAVEALRRRLRALAVEAEPVMPRGLKATLRAYQRRGLAWLQFLQRLGAGGILADDMGLGKTLMTLAFLLGRREKEGRAPSLVVCPTSVATNWVREAARFTPKLRVLLLHGPERDAASIADFDVVVTTYALLRRDADALSAVRFRCVVLDEAQNIKNADSATTRAAGRLDASMRLALSGTPVENRLRELWSLSSFVNPGILGTSRAFETRFERPIVADRASPLAAELRAIVRPFLLRRTKNDVLPDLPPKIEVDRVVLLGEHDKRTYDALAHTLRASIAKDLKKRTIAQLSLSVFTALTRLRQMACDPRLVDPSLASAPSAKREAFLDLVRELVAEGRRALVFSQFVQLLTLWRADLDAEGIAYEYLDGSTVQRDEVVTRFQTGTAPLFLISLKAGGAGLNLTAADTVIHCDPWWNPAVEDQATDRAHRIGQDKTVTVVRLVARGTIEEKILSLKAKKRELTRAIVGDDARALEGLTEDDVRTLLGDAADDTKDDATSAGARRAKDAASEAPDEALATSKRVLSPDYEALVARARQWVDTTGQSVTQLALLADIPPAYALRLVHGEPFPCSRATADRITRRMREF